MHIPQRNSLERIVLLFIAVAAIVFAFNMTRAGGLWIIAGWVVAAAVLIFAGYRIVASHRFEAAHLQIDFPALPGATFSGRVVTGLTTPPSEIVVTLTCVHETTLHDEPYDKVVRVVEFFDNEPDTHPQVQTIRTRVFEQSQLVKRKAMVRSPEGIVAPFAFRIPMDARAGMIGQDWFLWRLEAEAEIPGIDFKASFRSAIRIA